MSKQSTRNNFDRIAGTLDEKAGKSIWNKLISPSAEGEDVHLARLLGGILLLLFVLGGISVLEYILRHNSLGFSNKLSIIAVLLFMAAFLLNRYGQFKAAVFLSLGITTFSVYVTLWSSHLITSDFYILFYLLIPILMAEFFLPSTMFIVTTILILSGLFPFRTFDPVVKDIASYLVIFAATIGAAGYYRKKLESNRQYRLLNIERRHARQMELLNSITHAALKMPDTHQALQVLADQLNELLNADGVFITLWDDELQRVIPSTAYGDFKETYHNTVIEPDEVTLTASVLREKHTLAIQDVRHTPYMDPRLAEGVPTHSALVLPLIAHDQKLGAAIISYNKPHNFTETEIALGEQAAGQIALALLKVQSLENEHRNAMQMDLLNSITHASLNTSNFREMTQVLADRMGELLGADGAFLTLWDEERNVAVPMAAYGKYRQMYPQQTFSPDEKSLTSSVLEAGHPLLIEDVMNTPYMSRSIAERFSTRSILALPLIINEHKLGSALIAFEEQHYFTRQEVEIGQRAAAQIALAMYKAHLIDVSIRQVGQLELLSDVGRDIANSLHETEILENAIEAVVKKFGYAEAAISLLVNNILQVFAISGTEDFGYQVGYRQDIGKGIIGHVAQLRSFYVTGDVAHDPYYFSTAKREGSALGVPMLDKDKLLGVIYVESTQKHNFKSDDIQTLQTLANLVANSIQKARLYTRAQEHLQAMTALQSVSQVVSSSLERDEILHNVIELIKDTFGYTYISIYLLQGELLHLGAQVGYPEASLIYDIPLTTGITGRAARTRESQFVVDVSTDSSFLRASIEVNSEICVPLLKNNMVLGVLNVESANERPLNENDLNLLNAIAGPITIAIDNARLHAQVKTLAMTDAVSELFNRHAFEGMLKTEIERATRYRLPLSLIIFDVDSFKDYNDKWGHPAGDARIKAIADLIRTNQRHNDIAARYGGDEFAIILPSTNKEGAYQFTKRLRDAARSSTPDKPVDGKGVPGYTLSMGFATFPQDGDTLAALLLAADQAELSAKRLGKNQIAPAGSSKDYESTSTFSHHDTDQ